MPGPESEHPSYLSLPRPVIVVPPHPSCELTIFDLKRYKTGKIIIGNSLDPDVVFSKDIDATHQELVKQAEVSALIRLVVSTQNNTSLTAIMRREKNLRTLREKQLIDRGVPKMKICPTMDELDSIFKVRRGGSEILMYSGSHNSPQGKSVLQINSRFLKEAEDLSINYNLYHELGPWAGSVAINIPFVVSPEDLGIFDDSDNSRIVMATGTLEKIGYHDAVDIILDAATATAVEFEAAIEKIDPLFREAEASLRQ